MVNQVVQRYVLLMYIYAGFISGGPGGAPPPLAMGFPFLYYRVAPPPWISICLPPLNPLLSEILKKTLSMYFVG